MPALQFMRSRSRKDTLITQRMDHWTTGRFYTVWYFDQKSHNSFPPNQHLQDGVEMAEGPRGRSWHGPLLVIPDGEWDASTLDSRVKFDFYISPGLFPNPKFLSFAISKSTHGCAASQKVRSSLKIPLNLEHRQSIGTCEQAAMAFGALSGPKTNGTALEASWTHLLQNRQRIQALIALYHPLNVPICIYWGMFGSVPTSFLRTILSDERRLWRDMVDPSWAIQHDEEVHFAKLVLSNHEMELLDHNKVLVSDMDEVPSGDTSVLVANDEDFELVEDNSGQLPRKTWGQFFLRWDQQRVEQQETPEKRQV
ncbi:hypothetical protein PM082_023214 [Marasmius tenuissimus]|nr:hypothetical protein PM082_023214 [Marasmius tenuissimus]